MRVDMLFLAAVTYLVTRINGDMLSLSEAGGFQSYVKLVAESNHLAGSIQRLPTLRARIHIIGSLENVVMFRDFLAVLQGNGIIESYENVGGSPVIAGSAETSFIIKRSDSLKARAGALSDPLFDAASHYSADDFGPYGTL